MELESQQEKKGPEIKLKFDLDLNLNSGPLLPMAKLLSMPRVAWQK
jgi:hypothetical protein